MSQILSFVFLVMLLVAIPIRASSAPLDKPTDNWWEKERGKDIIFTTKEDTTKEKEKVYIAPSITCMDLPSTRKMIKLLEKSISPGKDTKCTINHHWTESLKVIEAHRANFDRVVTKMTYGEELLGLDELNYTTAVVAIFKLGSYTTRKGRVLKNVFIILISNIRASYSA